MSARQGSKADVGERARAERAAARLAYAERWDRERRRLVERGRELIAADRRGDLARAELVAHLGELGAFRNLRRPAQSALDELARAVPDSA